MVLGDAPSTAPQAVGRLRHAALGGPAEVLRYLGRYTHSIAVSNHRLLAIDGERVPFRWRDYAHGGEQRNMTLSMPPSSCTAPSSTCCPKVRRIRHFRLLSNRED